MTTSIFLAMLIGPVALVVGLGILLNAAMFRRLAEEFLADDALVYLSGLITMTGGMAVVLTHNLWVGDWRVIITILGWLMVIGGAVRIAFPQITERIGRLWLKRPAVTLTVSAAIWLAFGLLLSYFGYVR